MPIGVIGCCSGGMDLHTYKRHLGIDAICTAAQFNTAPVYQYYSEWKSPEYCLLQWWHR